MADAEEVMRVLVFALFRFAQVTHPRKHKRGHKKKEPVFLYLYLRLRYRGLHVDFLWLFLGRTCKPGNQFI